MFSLLFAIVLIFSANAKRDVSQSVDQKAFDHQTSDRQTVVDQHEQHEEIRRDAEQEKERWQRRRRRRTQDERDGDGRDGQASQALVSREAGAKRTKNRDVFFHLKREHLLKSGGRIATPRTYLTGFATLPRPQHKVPISYTLPDVSGPSYIPINLHRCNNLVIPYVVHASVLLPLLSSESSSSLLQCVGKPHPGPYFAATIINHHPPPPPPIFPAAFDSSRWIFHSSWPTATIVVIL